MEAIEAQVITLEQAISTIKDGNANSLEEDIFKIKSIIRYQLYNSNGS